MTDVTLLCGEVLTELAKALGERESHD